MCKYIAYTMQLVAGTAYHQPRVCVWIYLTVKLIALFITCAIDLSGTDHLKSSRRTKNHFFFR